MQRELPPKLRLITRAGVGLSGTPLTGRPAAQRMPSTTSDSQAPHLPDTRTGRIRVRQLTPATPRPLLVAAAIWPAMKVPCQELSSATQPVKAGCRRSSAVTQSPGSAASASRPLPSLPVARSLIRSMPGSHWPARSGWSNSAPESSTATTWSGLPVLRAQAGGRFSAAGPPSAGRRKCHCVPLA